MPHVPGSFCWFECGTRDAAAAKTFYTQLFGWSAVDMPMPDTDGDYTLLQMDGEDIAGLYELSGPQFEGVPSHWMNYVTVESTDQSVARAQELGAKVLQPPMDVPGAGRMAMLADPGGATIAVFELGDHKGASEKTILGWGELHTPDTAQAKNFYTQLFPWVAKDDPKGGYAEFQLHGRSIGGMMAIPPERREHMPPCWMLYAMVEDCDDALQRATKLGASVIVPPQDIPDVGRFAVITDPTGASIALIRLTIPGATTE